VRKINQDPDLVAAKLRKLSRLRPSLAVVLGTGFGPLANQLEADAEIDYRELPGFYSPGVSGHAGKLLIGRLKNTPIMLLRGRSHFYEGHEMAKVTFPIRVLAHYPIKDLLLTNAAGAVNRRFNVGDLMVLRDHINFMGVNPLRGTPVESDLERFVDLTCVYDTRLRQLLQRAARASQTRLQTGVYLAVSGPSYETQAEIKAFARWGADAVGMSTVPEAIVARQCGLRVAALSCISNEAAGRSGKPLSHAEVLQSGGMAEKQTVRLLATFARIYGQSGI
jgi:purine-nucleoside phosphorylase